MEMRRTVVKSVAIAALGVATTAVPAIAHHSGSMFDGTKTVVIAGTVKELQWTNPHSYIWIYKNPDKPGESVTDPDLLWAIELTSPGDLKRMGWSKDIVKPGDKVTISIRPLRSGSHGGGIVDMTLADGTVIKHDRSLGYLPRPE
jgi:hypothetical protein